MTTRSPAQQNSIELYCHHLADALNDAGLDMKKVFEVKTVDVPWTQDLVKDVLWREIQIAMFDKKSTTKLETDEVGKVFEVLNRHIAEHFHLSVPFPDRQEMDDRAQGLSSEAPS